MRLLLFAIAIIWFGNETRASETADITAKVEKGTEVATEIIKTLGDEKVSKTFGKIGQIASKIGPFLGAIGPAIALLGLFSDSPELSAIKEGFANMDKKFNAVFDKFDEVNNLIRETSLKTQYVQYEHTILALSRLLQRMLSSKTKEDAAAYKDIFVEKYASSDELATANVWLGMMVKGVFSVNIPHEAMKYFANDRKKVQKVMKGTINLILQGVKVELAYEKARGNDASYAVKERLWKDRIARLIANSKEYDEEVRDKYHDQLKIDVDKKLKEWIDKGHQDFANSLYYFLAKKYDWRTWFVMSYNEIYGSGKHWGHQCDGYSSFRKYNKNVRVASFDTDSQGSFNRNLAGRDITALTYKSDAETMYNDLPKRWTQYCSGAAAAGVIREAVKDVKFSAPWYRMNYVQGRVFVYIFG